MSTIKTIGIVGAGTMGSALTQKFAQEGFSVIMMDREDRFVTRGMEGIRNTLNEGLARRIFSEEKVKNVLGNIATTTDLNKLSRCHLIIEAVFENLKVKQTLFSQLSEAVPADTIIATNTSSFSVTELAESVSRPERFIGLHFFYHAAKNRLVEIIKGQQTSDESFNRCLWFMQQSGKDPIVCRDVHGFAVNRFFVPWLNEAVRIFEEGIAAPAVIDAAACKTFGCGMGPFALMNATGVPIAYHAQKTLEQAFGKFYAPAETLRKQMEKNLPWEMESPEKPDPEILKTISERLLDTIFFVCGQILDEKVCSAGDISRGAGVGLKWRKTPVDLFHRYGEEKVGEMVSRLSDKWKVNIPKALSAPNWIPDFVTSDRKGAVGTVTVNRPEGMNAINPFIIEQLAGAFDRLNDDPSISTIIITGQGKAFVAGADIKFFLDHIRRQTIHEIVKFTSAGQKLFQRIDRSEKKIIAVVNGMALGGGLELALTADVILALDKALFAFPETGIGIYPGLGGTQRTIDRVGTGLTKYMIYTGQMLNAAKAKEMGLVDGIISWDEFSHLGETVDKYTRKPAVSLSAEWKDIEDFFNNCTVFQLFDERCSGPEKFEKLIKRIRKKAPVAMRITERLINDRRGPESELVYIEDIFRTQDAFAGLQSIGKEPPVYKGI